MRAVRFLVEGRVQGVGFRAAACRRARELGLGGYARNLPDGRVEVLAQGEDARVETFSEWLRHGPPLARVDRVQREAVVVGESTGFHAG
jgi:acylphosphatase